MTRRGGFSIFECLVTLVIISIVFAYVVPSFRFFLAKSQDQVSVGQLLRAISLARSEAQLRGKAISLCKSADHATCSGQWQEGALLFVDEKESGELVHANNVIKILYAVSQTGKLFWRSSLHRDYLQILPTGLTPGENGTFWFCDSHATHPSWAIIINQAGRARVAYPDEQGKIGTLAC